MVATGGTGAQDLELRLTLLNLAFQTANGEEIDKNIKADNSDRRRGRACWVGTARYGTSFGGLSKSGVRTHKKHCDFAPKLGSF